MFIYVDNTNEYVNTNEIISIRLAQQKLDNGTWEYWIELYLKNNTNPLSMSLLCDLLDITDEDKKRDAAYRKIENLINEINENK